VARDIRIGVLGHQQVAKFRGIVKLVDKKEPEHMQIGKIMQKVHTHVKNLKKNSKDTQDVLNAIENGMIFHSLKVMQNTKSQRNIKLLYLMVVLMILGTFCPFVISVILKTVTRVPNKNYD